MRRLSFSARHLFLLFLLVGVLSGGGYYVVFETQIVAALSGVTLNNGVTALSVNLDLESQTTDLGSDIGAYQWTVDPDGGGGAPVENLMDLNIPFNSGATQTDFSGDSHSGSVSEAIVPADPGTDCKVGTCLDFDASNDYVSVSGTFGGTSEATVSAWVKVEANTGNFQSVVSPTDQSFIHLQVNYPNGDGNLAVYTNSTTILLPMITLSTGTWHHVAISSRSGSTKAYVNGSEVSSSASTFSTINSTGSLNIGRGFSGGRFFNGMIDEVQIYSRALTSQQISRLYSDGNAGFGAPTIIESEETVLGEVWDLSVTPITTVGSISSVVDSSNTVTIAPPYSVQLENSVYTGSPANEQISSTEDLNSYVFYNGVSGFDVNTIGAYQWSVDPDGVGGAAEESFMSFNAPFNSGTQEDFSTGTDGVVTDAVVTTVGCQVGTCMTFDGNADYVTFADSAAWNFSDEVTLSAWFSTSQANANGQAIVSQGTASNQYSILFWVSGSTNDDNVGLYINTASGNFAAACSQPEGTLFNGAWHHYVGTYKRSTHQLKMYLDGSDVACGTAVVPDEPLNDYAGGMHIGRLPFSTSYLNGKVDEVQVYSRALSDAQIDRLYADGLAGLGGPSIIESEETVNDQVWDLSVTPISTSGTIGSVITSANTVEIVSTNIQILDPNGGETILAGSDYLITWSASDSLGVNTVDLEYTLNDLNYVSIDTNLPAENYYLFDSQFGSSGSANGQFTNSREIVIDSSGNIYVADQTNARVQKFDSNHNFIGWIGNCSAGTNCNVGAQVTTSFCSDCTPTGVGGSGDGQFTTSLQRLTVDSSGNIYVSESGQRRVQKFNSNGTFQLKWGTDGTANGQLSENNGVAVDASGNVYVAELSAYRVQKFNSSGSFLGWFGSCSAGTNCNVGGGVTTALCTDCTVGTSGTGDGQFFAPHDLVVDSSGNIYVLEATLGNARVQKFNSSGTFVTKWGSYGSGEGQFDSAYSLTTDTDDNIYVAEWQNFRFQKFDNSGVYLAQGGTNGTGDGQFTGLFGIAVSADGTVYANDWGGPVDRIQLFTPGGSYLWSVPFANSPQARIRSTVFGGDGSASDTSDAVFTIETNQVISGTCRQSDNTTNCSDGFTVRVAVNGVLLGGSDTTSSGTWSIPAGSLNSDDVIAVFLDGVNETNEAVAITKYDGTGDVTGVELIESHLTIGSDDNASVTNADMALYDNSVSGDEDIFFEVDANNDLVVDDEGGHDEKLLIFVGNTYRPDSTGSGNVTTDDIQNDGTFIADGNTIFVSGDWLNTGTFTANTSTVDFTSTATQSLISGGDSFATVTHSGSGTLQLAGNLTVTPTFNNSAGTFDLNGYDWTMTGASLFNDGTIQLQGNEAVTMTTNDTNSGTWRYVGDGADGITTFGIISDFSSGDYYHLIIDADASETFDIGNTLTVNGDFSVLSGSFDQLTNNATVSGNLALSDASYTQGSGTLTVDGSMTMTVGSVFDGSDTGAAIDVNGNNLTIAGSFTSTSGTLSFSGQSFATGGAAFLHNSGTVVFDRTGSFATQTIDGGTFHHFTKSTSEEGQELIFSSANTFTFEGDLTLQGGGSNFLTIQGNAGQWYLDAQGSRTVSRLLVRDSNNISATIDASGTNSSSLGNNFNWVFEGGSYGRVFSDEGVTPLTVTTYTVRVAVNGVDGPSVDINSNGEFDLSGLSFSNGDVLTFYLEDETPDAVTVILATGSTLSGQVHLYQDRLIVRSENAGTPITNAHLTTAWVTGETATSGNTGDVGAIYQMSSGVVTTQSSKELFIWSGTNYQPGANVNIGTGGVDINGVFTMESNTVNVAGNWDATGGTSTSTGTVHFNGPSQTIIANEQAFHHVTMSGVAIKTIASDFTVNGNFDYNPTGWYVVGSGAMRTIHLHGNFSYTGTLGSTFGQSNLTLRMTGTNEQTMSKSATENFNAPLVIDKSSGSVTLLSNFAMNSSFTLTSGEVTGGGFSTSSSYTQTGGNVTITGGGQVSVAGNFSLSGGTLNAVNFTGSGGSLSQTGGTLTDVTFSSSGIKTITSDFTVNGNLDYNPTGWYVTGSGAMRTIYLHGNFSYTGSAGSTFGLSNLTLRMTGTNEQTMSKSATENFSAPLVIDKSSGSVTLLSNFAMTSSFTLTSGDVLLDSYLLTANGGATISPGTTMTSSTGGGFSTSSSYTQTGGDVTVTGGGNVSVAGNFSLSGGTLNTVNFYGAGGSLSQTGGTLTDVTISSNGIKTITSDFTVNGNLAYNSGGWYVTGDATPRTIHLSGNFSYTGTLGSNFGLSNLTLRMTGTNEQTISKTPTENFGALLVIDKASGGVSLASHFNFISGKSLTITNGTFALDGYDWTMSGVTFSNTNNGTIQLQGNETITGLTPDINSGTWVYLGDGAGGLSTFTLKDFGATDYYNVTFEGDASETLQQGAATVIANTLQVTSGTYSQNGFDTAVNGANTLIIDGGTYEQGNNPLTVEGNLQVLNSGIFNGSNTGAAIDVNGDVDIQVSADTVRLTSGTMTVAGDWTNAMVTGFDNNNGTVRLDTSAAAAVNGSTTWYNLVLEPAGKTVTFEAGEVQTFETGGDLSATGTSGNLINFVSSVPGVTQWEITHADENSGNLSYVSVTDGGCVNSNFLILTDSVDNGNNDSCWHFGTPAVPDAISDLDALAGDTQVSLTWSAPAGNGSLITDYIIEYGLTVGFPGNAQVFNEGVSAVTGATVTGLANNSEYSFRVAAVNAIGTGPYSNVDTATPVPPPAEPDAVNDLVATAANGQVGLAWSAPANNGSSITDYIVEFGVSAGFPGNAQVFNDGVSSLTGATVTGLINGTEYSFRVAAVNGVGTGPYSNVDTATPAAGSAPEPTDEFDISVDINDFLSFSIENLALGDEPAGNQPFGAGGQITDLTSIGSNDYAISGSFGSPVYTQLQTSTNSSDGYSVIAYASNLDGRTNTLLRSGGTPGTSSDEMVDSLSRLPAAQAPNVTLVVASATGIAFRLMDANTDISLREADEDTQWGDGDAGTALWASFPLGSGAAQVIYDTVNFSDEPTTAFINWFVGVSTQQQSGSYSGQVTFTASVN